MSASLLTTTVRMKDQDANGVYFCENSWHTSYSGCVYEEENSSMTEQEIAEFIRHSNTSLYEKLNGVRIASSHLPCDDDDHHGETGDKSGDADGLTPEAIEIEPASLSCETDIRLDNHTAGSSGADCPSETDLTYTSSPPPTPATEPIVIGRYHFSFYQHCEPGTVYCCSSPTCPNPRNVIPVGNYFGIIRDQGLGEEKDDQLTEYNRTAYYCLDCLDEVVDREEHLVQGQKLMVPHPQLVDGDGAQPGRNPILHKALEMYPVLQEKDFFFVRVPDDEASDIKPGEASNSKKVIRFRRQKQLETHRITQELREQRFTHLHRKRETKPDPSGLRILPPLESQPYRERYKKQGLEWVDRLEGSESRQTRRDEDRPAATNNHTSTPALEMVEMPVCYCREPADQGPMLCCRSASCMFGPIHFRCSGLNQLPLDTEDFWCDYCMSDSTGHTEQVCGNGVVGKRTSAMDNVLNISDVGTDDGDSTITASEDEKEEDSEVESDTVQSAHGFVAVNHVSPEAKG
ncbi:uncharacterized protein Z520_02248 [Fonsecaea multimorphosa CBS 102226]|uniref:Zinc finger PHD-type domain-containing protein n=1 Tax=Fonsecaea multimorphosa CBS 102226 TaxID=1442371 RepID=A0A0D2KFA3_9EURO|nr:uncharacterized protein Z520_02248 [Fonsecaea multimorphosa CBS 102226]KIY02110.1 hypothetical protein Z520_02248 [Fonsecaea multimorphosa CBS 102226]OAL29309.1 hypothetical protein AYO22_02203 [Fonsecaea multimorphosa]